MQKIVTLIAVITILAVVLTGCNVSVTSTSTVTESHTDANGNTTTTTTTTQNGTTETSATVEGSSAEPEIIIATVTFQNDTGFTIHKLVCASSSAEKWGPNLLGKEPLEDGSKIVLEKSLTYTSEAVLWDLKITNADGQYLEFDCIDFSAAADPEDITIVIAHNSEDDTYSVCVK